MFKSSVYAYMRQQYRISTEIFEDTDRRKESLALMRNQICISKADLSHFKLRVEKCVRSNLDVIEKGGKKIHFE